MTRGLRELGGRLAPARASRPIETGERIHVLGIAGAGASAAALHARAAGAVVTGCDPGGRSPYTNALEAIGIPMEWLHDPAHIAAARPDRLAVTKALTAINPDHPELLAAARAGIPLEAWQQVVADAAHGRTLVAVAGTHGKSTTAGWLAWILAEAGLDPSAFVGALLPAALSGGIPATGRVGRGAPFVVEADEYAGNFDPYRPHVVALTTVEWDHPDVFADRAAVIETFAAWLEMAPDATIVANLADAGVTELLSVLSSGDRRRIVGVRLAGTSGSTAAQGAPAKLLVDRQISGTIVERSPDGTVLEIEGLDDSTHRVHLSISGDHNAANALVALATAWLVASDAGSTVKGGVIGGVTGGVIGGVTHGGVGDIQPAPDRLLWGLASFPGIGRRLERKGEARGVVVYDDYGHHPTAIRATLSALRQREPDRRLWAVYEPLTFHRTAAMLDDFADALADADAVAVANIWASRDPDTTITSSSALATAVRRRRPAIPAEAPGSVEETAAWLARNVAEGDAVLVMGGGKSYRIAELLLEALHGGR